MALKGGDRAHGGVDDGQMTHLAAPFSASPSFPAPSSYPQILCLLLHNAEFDSVSVTAFITERKEDYNWLRSNSKCAILSCLDSIADGLSPQLHSLLRADREVSSFLPSMT